MQIRHALFIFSLIPLQLFGLSKEDFESQMQSLESKEYIKIENFLKINETKLATDPDYYVVLLNYAFRKGSETGVVVAKGKPQKGDLALVDPKTNAEVGFLGERTQSIDKDLIINSIKTTQKALPHFKDRLDIHFGIVSIAEKTKEWSIVEEQLISILKISKEIENQWKWGYVNKMTDDPKAFMLDNIESRCSKLFEINSEPTNKAFKNVSESLIKIYPDLIYGYANIGTYYLAKGDFEKAEEFYNKAIKIDPDDEIVLHNLDYIRRKKSK